MRRISKFIALATAGVAVASVLLPAPADASPHARIKVLRDDLSSPKGLAIDRKQNLVVGQGAFGAPGPVLVLDVKGKGKGGSGAVTPTIPVVDVAVSPRDNTRWFLTGDGHLRHQLANGTIVDVLDVIAYQAGDPDPYNTNGPADESNPYGLAVLPNGDALVADAAGNDLIRVTPAGVATTVARFDSEFLSTAHVGDPTLPPTIPAEAVPTSIAIGDDGEIYVGELKGFPFTPGASHVWRISPKANGVLCSVNTPSRKCTIEASGLTAIQDIAVNPRGGNALYVLELAEGGVLAFEGGLASPEGPPPAVLLKVKHKKVQELSGGLLREPGGISISDNGSVFVTDRIFTPGGGRISEVK